MILYQLLACIVSMCNWRGLARRATLTVARSATLSVATGQSGVWHIACIAVGGTSCPAILAYFIDPAPCNPCATVRLLAHPFNLNFPDNLTAANQINRLPLSHDNVTPARAGLARISHRFGCTALLPQRTAHLRVRRMARGLHGCWQVGGLIARHWFSDL